MSHKKGKQPISTAITFSHVVNSKVTSVHLSPDFKFVFVGTADSRVIIYDAFLKDEIRDISVKGFPTGEVARNRIDGILKSRILRSQAWKDSNRRTSEFSTTMSSMSSMSTNYFEEVMAERKIPKTQSPLHIEESVDYQPTNVRAEQDYTPSVDIALQRISRQYVQFQSVEFNDSTLDSMMREYKITIDEFVSKSIIESIIHIDKHAIAISFNNIVVPIAFERCGTSVFINEVASCHTGHVKKIIRFGRTLVSLANDRKIGFWSATTGESIGSIQRTDQDDYYSCSEPITHKNKNYLLIGGSRVVDYGELNERQIMYEVAIFKIEQNNPSSSCFLQYLHHNYMSPHDAMITSIKQLNESILFTGSQDGTFILWDISTFSCIHIVTNSLAPIYTKMRFPCPSNGACLIPTSQNTFLVALRDFLCLYTIDEKCVLKEVSPPRDVEQSVMETIYGRFPSEISHVLEADLSLFSTSGKRIVVVCSDAGTVFVYRALKKDSMRLEKTEEFSFGSKKITVCAINEQYAVFGTLDGSIEILRTALY